MKIGLLTVYSFNYGSFYQAKALQKQLQDMGHECELINEEFKKKEWGNLFLLYTFHNLMPKVFRPLICKVLPQYNTFLQLQKDVCTLPQSPARITDMEEISKRYDCIVLGSDELWSANPASIRYTPAYFGYGIKCPHITYAPSATLFDLENEELLSKVKDGMNSYCKIAVRDTHSKEVVKRVTGKDVPVVLDPTLLNPFFAKPEDEEVPGEYVLVYGQHYDENQREIVRKTAKRLGMKVMALGWPQDWTDGFLNPDTAEGFQQVFVKAAYSFPSTFHGTVFSILHRRPFMSMLNPLRGGKVKMLLNQLNLQDRIYDPTHPETVEAVIDYEHVHNYIGELRQQSLSYLKDALATVNVVGHQNCSGCGACAGICPKHAITMQEDEEGFLYPVVDEKLCIHCGICKTYCPMSHPEKKKPDQVWACRIKEEELCKDSASGGAFRLASDVILTKGMVAGAVFDEKFQVKTVLTDNESSRDQMRGSKYVQSDMGQIYEDVRQAIDEGKQVLFTGTPCQCAGMKAYAKRYLQDKSQQLYLCDIVCHGTPSPKVWKDYLQKKETSCHKKITNVTFRSKDLGWHKQSMKLQFADGTVYQGTTVQDPFYIMYFAHYCHRPSCHSCPFASYERCSDLTFGDFWGIEEIQENDADKASILKQLQDEQGTSLVMVNTEHGEELWKKMQEHAITYQSNLDSCYQAIFENPPKVSGRRKEFWNDYREQGYDFVENKFGRLHFKQKMVKLIFAPLVRKLGIYNFAQKLYFGRRSKNGKEL